MLTLILLMLTLKLHAMDPLNLDIFKSSAGKNFVFSPWSLSSALGLLYPGAKGATAAEISKVTGWASPADQNQAMQSLNELFQGELANGNKLENANSIWLQEGQTFLPEYLQQVSNFNAGLYSKDFVNKYESVRLEINKWVEDKTHDKIKDLLTPGTLSPETRMVLCNAVYLKAKWQSPFEDYDTHDAEFHAPDGVVKVPTMHQTSSFRYWEDKQCQYLMLPYRGSQLYMVVCLPKQVDGLAAFIKDLDGASLTQTLKSGFIAEYERVEVSLPKWKTESTLDKLSRDMRAAGLTKIFGGGDLSGLTGEPGLFVSDVIQKAMIDVSEEGTEAAAATAMMVAGCSMMPAKPVEFKADHPFAYFLFATPRSGNFCTLFAGTLVKP